MHSRSAHLVTSRWLEDAPLVLQVRASEMAQVRGTGGSTDTATDLSASAGDGTFSTFQSFPPLSSHTATTHLHHPSAPPSSSRCLCMTTFRCLSRLSCLRLPFPSFNSSPSLLSSTPRFPCPKPRTCLMSTSSALAEASPSASTSSSTSSTSASTSTSDSTTTSSPPPRVVQVEMTSDTICPWWSATQPPHLLLPSPALPFSLSPLIQPLTPLLHPLPLPCVPSVTSASGAWRRRLLSWIPHEFACRLR